jgi:cell division protein FtsZ
MRPEARPSEERVSDIAPPPSFEIDEAPLPPRQIPPHLQQPLRPQTSPLQRNAARPVEAKPGHKPGLPSEPAPAAPRKSLFGIVTGAIRGHAAEQAAAHQEPRMEPQTMAPPREAPQAQVRQAASEEIGIEIPAFLRRQS